MYKKGDVLKAFANFNVLVHGCNCFCTMGAGIAKQIKQLWPNVYFADLKTKKGDPEKLGTYQLVQIAPEKYVANAYTQFSFWKGGDQVSYEAIQNIFKGLYFFVKEKNFSICMPKIGAGLAGGDWSRIEGIINTIFTDYPIHVFEL